MTRYSRTPRPSATPRRTLRCEQLEARDTPSVTAVFNGGILSVTSDAAGDFINVGTRNGVLIVQTTDSAFTRPITEVPIQTVNGTQPLLAQTALIQVDGGAGDDDIFLDASLNTRVNGVLVASPNSVLSGGDGNDGITVFNGGFLNGVVGGPAVGNSVMDGGAGNDNLKSGFGNDIMRGGDGDDQYTWNPGTLTDTWDGGAGNDTVLINGNGGTASDAFLLRAKPDSSGRVLFDRTNLVPFTVDIGSTESIILQPDINGDRDAGNDTVTVGSLLGVTDLRSVTVLTGGGNDTIDASAARGTDFATRAAVFLNLDGGAGNDTLTGSVGGDRLSGGAGDDQLSAGFGQDELFGGDGNDVLDGGADGFADRLTGGAGKDVFVGNLTPAGLFEDVFVDVNPGEGDVFGLPRR